MRILAFLVMWFAATSLLAQPTVNIATEEYPPYTSSKLYKNGLDAHIVSRAFELEGYTVTYSFHPAARSFNMTQEGKFDATLPWAKRADRENDFLYSDPVIEVEQEYLFFKKDRTVDWNPAQPDYSKLSGKRFGAIIAYNYGQDFQQAESQKIIETFRSGDLNHHFEMLLKERLDFVISKRQVAHHILQQQFSLNEQSLISSIAENHRPKTYDYLLISKRTPNAEALLKAVNSGLAKLKSSGEYQRILNAFEHGVYSQRKP